MGSVLPSDFLRDWPRDAAYGYDVDHIDLEMFVDFTADTINAVGTLTVTITEPGLTEIPVDLDTVLWTGDITIDDVSVSYTRTADQILISPGAPPDSGTQIVIAVPYSGQPQEVGNKSMRFRTHGNPPVPSVYTISTPYSNAGQTVIPISHYWRPCKDQVYDKSTFSCAITVPDTMMACSNGLLASNVDNLDGTRTFSWEHNYEVAPYLITVGATNYVTIEETWEGATDSVDIQHFVYPERYTQALVSWDVTTEGLAVLDTIFGTYPFTDEKYGMFTTAPGPAVEEQTMVAYPYNLVNGGHAYDWIVVHELGHMWYGDCMTVESWEHVWLSEGFASYSEALWKEATLGSAVFRSYMNNMDNGPYSGTIFDPPYVWHAIVYDKAAWLVHMLRHVLGDEDFFQLLLDYRDAFEYSNVVTDDFVGAAETAYGDTLNWFFDQWLYFEGRPDYEYVWEYDGTGPYTITLTVDQVQSLSYPTYTMPIDVVVTAGDLSTEEFVIWDSLQTQVFELVVQDEPISLEMDPNDWVLADFREVPSGVPGVDRHPAFLAQNAPNPFNPRTSIRFGLSRDATVALRVFDVTGRMVRTLIRGELPGGEHVAAWDGTTDLGAPVASGIYFYRLVGPDGVQEKSMVLMR